MKKIMLFTMMMVLALVVGSAYADESATWAGNGITVFRIGPAEFDNVPLGATEMSVYYEEGSAAGGWREEEALVEPYNGTTIFSAGPVDFETVTLGAGMTISTYEESSAAGGLHLEEATLTPENGITIFSNGPVAFDSVPEARW